MNKLKKLCPYSGELLYEFPIISAVDLVRVIQAAQMAFQAWRDSSLEDRISFLLKIRDQYQNMKKDLIASESLDQGLPYFFTEKSNYAIGLQLIDQFLNELQNQKNSENDSVGNSINGSVGNSINGSVGVVQCSPHGVTTVILSWNLSNRLFIEKVLGAVLAGNSVIVKCSSQAVSTGLQWQQLLTKISPHPDLIQFVQGEEQAFKDLLVTHPGIKAVSFTGTLSNATTVLKKVSAVSHLQFKKLQINCGAKNAAIALAEPTSQSGQEILESFIMGSGQLAWNAARFFTLEKFEKIWLEYIRERLTKLRPLESPEQNQHPDILWTPIIKKSSSENYLNLYQQALQDHAKLISATQIDPKDFIDKNFDSENFPPPIFTQDMSKCSTLQQDEIQTPIFIFSATKYPFDIAKMNNVSYYGHSANIWSDSLDAKSKLVQQLEVGQVSVNQWSVYLAQPFSAVKQSAFGLQNHRIFGAFNSNVKIMS